MDSSGGTNEKELLRKGVEALQAGDRVTASQLLSDVVDLNPLNEQAWFYLAAAEADPFMRKRYLQRVLELNPRNTRARDVLTRIQEREDAAKPVETSPKPLTGTLRPPAPTTEKSMPPVYTPEPVNEPNEPPPASLPFVMESIDDVPDFNALASSPKAVARPVSTTPIDSMDELRSPGVSGRSAAPASSGKSSKPTLKVLSPDAGSLLGAVTGDQGFPLPFHISGSPARVSVASIGKAGVTLLRTGTRILRRQPNEYVQEIDRVTWWRLLLYTVFTAAISTITLMLIVCIYEGWLTATALAHTYNFFSPILTLLLGIPFYAATLLGGAGISWLILRLAAKPLQATVRQPYLKHAYMVAAVWLPLSIVASIVALILSVVGLSVVTILTTTLIAVYAGYIIQQGITRLYGIEEVRRTRIASGIAVGGIFVAQLLIGGLLAAITGAAVWVFVFS